MAVRRYRERFEENVKVRLTTNARAYYEARSGDGQNQQDSPRDGRTHQRIIPKAENTIDERSPTAGTNEEYDNLDPEHIYVNPKRCTRRTNSVGGQTGVGARAATTKAPLHRSPSPSWQLRKQSTTSISNLRMGRVERDSSRERKQTADDERRRYHSESSPFSARHYSASRPLMIPGPCATVCSTSDTTCRSNNLEMVPNEKELRRLSFPAGNATWTASRDFRLPQRNWMASVVKSTPRPVVHSPISPSSSARLGARSPDPQRGKASMGRLDGKLVHAEVFLFNDKPIKWTNRYVP